MKLLTLIILLLNLNCSAQKQEKYTNEYIYGNWKCVKFDKRGLQKYTLQQAQKLQSSVLTVEKDKFYYNDIDFIELCSFNKWKISNYDTTNLSGNILDVLYKKKELSKIRVLEPVDDKEEPACYNNCAEFYFKDDTLINICGGYTYFLLKVKEEPKERELTFKEFNGTGNFKQKIDLNSCNAVVKIDYNFYQVADRIILEGADGNILFSTEMESTTGIKSITTDIKLTAREQCYFYLKVESSQKEKSKWELKVTLSEY